jgi:hypothetical protein
MPHFQNIDIAFDYPREWEDRSVIAFAAPTKPGQTTATNVVVNRDALADGEDIKRYADRQLVAMAKGLDGFQLVERREIHVDNEPAVDVRFAWRGKQGQLVQRLTMVAKERKVFNITCTSSKKDAPEFGPFFDRIISSIKLGAAS